MECSQINLKTYLFLLPLILFCNLASAEIYKWTDENGRIHFGDSPHEKIGDKKKDLSKQYAQPTRNFSVTVSPVNYDLPLDTKRKIITAVTKTFLILNEYSNIPFKESVNISVKVFGNQQEFLAYQKKHISKIISKSGYYSPKSNQAVVWKNRNVKRMLSVITHEAFHTILWTNYKHIPSWLNEGFAEYFELINVFGTTAVIELSDYWVRIVKTAIRQDAAPSLKYFINMDRKQWKELNKESSLSYAMGWSLVYYLMSSKEGRKLIVELFRERNENPDMVMSDIIKKHYPEGITQLQIYWENWVFGKKTTHRY